MNAYFFTASTTSAQIRPVDTGRTQIANRPQIWNSCCSLIVCTDTADEAQKRFEEWVVTQPEDDDPIQTRINRIVAAQFMDQLLTEIDCAPINWREIAEQVESVIAATSEGVYEEGYWVDVNSIVPARELSSTIEALRETLTEDIRSGLNWSPNKQFFFLISVLAPPPPPEPTYEIEEDISANTGAAEANFEAFNFVGYDKEHMTFPDLVEKEAAVVIQARNSVIAAWLWRRYAAKTPLAGNDIRIDPWCGIMGVEAADGE